MNCKKIPYLLLFTNCLFQNYIVSFSILWTIICMLNHRLHKCSNRFMQSSEIEMKTFASILHLYTYTFFFVEKIVTQWTSCDKNDFYCCFSKFYVTQKLYRFEIVILNRFYAVKMQARNDEKCLCNSWKIETEFKLNCNEKRKNRIRKKY